MTIPERLKHLQKEIPRHVKIIAVSKTIPAEEIMLAYEAGQRAFGENRVQELHIKQQLLPKDIQWHLIGHLQTNKVKFVVPYVHMIHSVDSVKLFTEINREASKIHRTVDCLLQMRIAKEENKFGLSVEEAMQIIDSKACAHSCHVRIRGLMGMATFTSDEHLIKEEFLNLAGVFHRLKETRFAQEPSFDELSMGMSGDYRLAIESGSTMVRIGSLIFGERNYHN